MDVDDEDYFNPSIYFICKLCQHSFTSVTQLLSHKRSQHTKQELKGIKCIIFEESFVETIVEDPFKSILQNSDSINCNKTAESTLQERHGKNSCKRNTSSNSKSGLGVLPNPYVRLTQLTPSEINSFLKTANRSVNGNDIFAQEQNVYSKKNETPISNTVSNNASLEAESSSSSSLPISARNFVPHSQSHTISNSHYSHSDSDAQDPNNDGVASVFKNSDGIENIQFESIRVVPSTNKIAKVTATSATSSPLEKWIENQKQIRYSDGRQNVILFSEYSTSASSAAAAFSTFKISKESPVTCILCATKLVTEAEFQNHCENCYLHNKDRHIYCISCNKNFKNPQVLNFHLLDVHLTSENLPGLEKPGRAGDSDSSGLPTGPGPEPEIEDQNKLDCYNLPLAEWLTNRNKNFPDFIMLDPDPTQPEFHVGGGVVINWLTCKLCNAKLESEAEVKKHVSGCWPYNKLNHSFCVRCKTADWESEDLLKHRRNTHLRKSLLLSSPFFCIECNLEFQTQDELDHHENSLQQFWKNMLSVIESDWEIFNSTITPSSYPNPDPSQDSRVSGADSDSDSNNSGIYLAENIFDDKPEIRPPKQSRILIPPTKRKHKSMTNSTQEFGTISNSRKRIRLPRKQNIDTRTEVKTATASLADWLHLQKYRKYPDGSVNVILLHPNPASALHSKHIKIGTKNRVTCKLCGTNLETEADVKNHAENCWLHNKDRHIFCISCKRIFKNPIQLQKHSSRKKCYSLEPGEGPEIEDMLSTTTAQEVVDKNLDLDHLPLGEWIQNRKQIFPDIILVDPDPTSASYLNSVNRVGKQPTRGPSSSAFLTCKLCRFKCQSEKLMKCHVQICWPYNKKNHIYCVPCSRAFISPKELENHERVSMFHPFKPKPPPSVFCRDCHQEFCTDRELETHQDSAQEFFRKMKQIQAVMNIQRYKVPAAAMLPRSGSSTNSTSGVVDISNSNGVTSSDQYRLTEVPVKIELQEYQCEDKNLLDGDQDALLAVTQADPCQEKRCPPGLNLPPVKTIQGAGAELYRHNGEEYMVQSRYKNGSVQYKCRKKYCTHRILWFPDSTIITKGKHNHRIFPTDTATSTSPVEALQSTPFPAQNLSHEINTGDSYLSKLRQNEAAKAQQKFENDYQRKLSDYANSLDEDCLPLGEWVQNQKETNPQHIIILEPDPTGPEFVMVSEKYPIKCGLCHWTFTSAVQVRHHAKFCWTENKDKHVYCAICETNYETPIILGSHFRTKHFSNLVNPMIVTKTKHHQELEYYAFQASRTPPAILKGGKTQ